MGVLTIASTIRASLAIIPSPKDDTCIIVFFTSLSVATPKPQHRNDCLSEDVSRPCSGNICEAPGVGYDLIYPYGWVPTSYRP